MRLKSRLLSSDGRRPRRWNKEDVASQREFLTMLGHKLGLKTLDDWYSILPSTLRNKANGLMKLHGFNKTAALTTIWPDHPWDTSKLSSKAIKPPPEEVKSVLERWGDANNVKTPEDWRRTSLPTVLEAEHVGYLLRTHFSSSLISALRYAFPDQIWNEWQFQKAPNSYWGNPNAARKFFDWFMTEKPLKSMDDWYKVTRGEIRTAGGGYLITDRATASLGRALMEAYPEHDWHPWEFTYTPHGIWDDATVQRKYMEWVAKEINLDTMEKWYSVKALTLIKKYKAASFLSRFGGSLISALRAVYPDHEWLPWKFNTVGPGFWKDMNTQREYLNWASRSLGIEKHEDWYNINSDDFKDIDGTHLLMNYYDNSVIRMLRAHYPEVEWVEWKFKKVPTNFWGDVANHYRFFEWAAEQLGIKTHEGWYSVTRQQILDLGGDGLLMAKYDHSVVTALMSLYPNHQWEPSQFLSRRGGSRVKR